MQASYNSDTIRPHRPYVLLVEDERTSRRALTALLNAHGFETEAVESAEEALRLLNRSPLPPVALVDLNLPGMSGIELINHLQQMDPGVFPVLITATAQEVIDDVLAGRDVAYLRKPFSFDRLLSILQEQGGAH